HAERRLRIVDDHLVFARDVVLRVVADRADAQAAKVVTDDDGDDDRAASGLGVPGVVDEELHANHVFGGADRNIQFAVDEGVGLLRDSYALGVGRRDKPETRNQKPEEERARRFHLRFNVAAMPPISGFWFLVSGFWFLVSGFWFLVSGFWFLVSGFWFQRTLAFA